MTNRERLQLIATCTITARTRIDEGKKGGLKDSLWDIECLIDAGGIKTLRPIIEQCKGQNELNNMEELEKSLVILGTRAKRCMDWW